MDEQRRGFWFGFSAYFLWGVFPLYFPLLLPAGADEVLAARIVFSLLVVAGLLTLTRGWRRAGAVLREPRRLALVGLGAVTIAVNWATYIWAVNHEHVVEAALGYFINPLVLVLMGVLLLGERLRPWQWVAVGIALVAVLQLTLDYGRLPWVALVLAFSFGTYGLMKKRAGLGAVEGLALETAILAPLALAWLVWLQADGSARLGHEGTLHLALMVGTGVITVIPLLLFGGAATRVPMTTLGLLQYVAPVMQFALGVLVFSEPMSTSRWVGFGLVWLALLVLTVESALTRRRAVPRSVDVPVQA